MHLAHLFSFCPVSFSVLFHALGPFVLILSSLFLSLVSCTWPICSHSLQSLSQSCFMHLAHLFSFSPVSFSVLFHALGPFVLILSSLFLSLVSCTWPICSHSLQSLSQSCFMHLAHLFSFCPVSFSVLFHALGPFVLILSSLFLSLVSCTWPICSHSVQSLSQSCFMHLAHLFSFCPVSFSVLFHALGPFVLILSSLFLSLVSCTWPICSHSVQSLSQSCFMHLAHLFSFCPVSFSVLFHALDPVVSLQYNNNNNNIYFIRCNF